MITTKIVVSKADYKAFVKFPFDIYKDSKYWVPPIISQELATFDTKKIQSLMMLKPHCF